MTLWIVFAAYFVALLVLGEVFGRLKIESLDDYLLSGREHGVAVTSASLIATVIGAGSTLGSAASIAGPNQPRMSTAVSKRGNGVMAGNREGSIKQHLPCGGDFRGKLLGRERTATQPAIQLASNQDCTTL